MKVEDLISGMYYMCQHKDYVKTYYFKYKKVYSDTIVSYGFEITENNYYLEYAERGDRFCSMYIFETASVFKEINISVIIDYLPINHIDRITYFRKQKIKLLLKL